MICLDHNKVINKLSDSELCQVNRQNAEEKIIADEEGWGDEIQINLDEMIFEEKNQEEKDLTLHKLSSQIVDHSKFDKISFEEYMQTNYLSTDVDNSIKLLDEYF